MQWTISEYKRGAADAQQRPVVQLQVDVLEDDGSVYARTWIRLPESASRQEVEAAALAAAQETQRQESARRAIEQNIIGMGGAL